MVINQVNQNAGNVNNGGPQWYDEKKPPTEPGIYYWETTREDGYQSPGLWYWDKKKERALPSNSFGTWRVYGPIPGSMSSILDRQEEGEVKP